MTPACSSTAAQAISVLSEPCRNFNFMAVVAMTDPRDGRDKLVLSNFVGGGRGTLIFLDPETGEAEVVLLPADEGAWALLVHDGKLIVGTCSTGGFLCALDLKTRTWGPPLPGGKNTYVWKIALGSDGRIYGGTFPTGSLVRSDPGCTTLEDLGSPCSDPGNRYCREVSGALPGYVLATGGFSTAFLGAYHISTGKWLTLAESDGSKHFSILEATRERIKVDHGGEVRYFDARTFLPVDADPMEAGQSRSVEFRMAVQPRLSAVLSDGREAGVRGQEYFTSNSPGGTRRYRRLPVPAAPTAIRSLTLDENGTVWGSCGFGQTIFRCDTNGGNFWNSLAVTERMGEVYGMVFVAGILYMSCYAGGDHLIYDPDAEWDERGNRNPRTLTSIYPDFQRPRAGSVLGPDGGVWTGWSARYGARGGCLSRMDCGSGSVTSWPHPVDEQQVMGISSDSRFIYFSTNSGGEGLPVRNVPGWFCVWDPSGKLLERHPLAEGDAVGKVLAVESGVLVVEGKALRKFDVSARTFGVPIQLDSPCFKLADLGRSLVAAICGSAIKIVDHEAGRVVKSIPVSGNVYEALTLPGGDLLFADGTKLCRLRATW